MRYFRVRFVEHIIQRLRYIAACKDSTVGKMGICLDAIDLFTVLVVPVETPLIVHPKQYEKAACKSYRKAEYVDRRVGLVPAEIAKSCLEVVFPHDDRPDYRS